MRATSGTSRTPSDGIPGIPLCQAGFGYPLTQEAAVLPVEIAQLLAPPEPPTVSRKIAENAGLLHNASVVVSVVSAPLACNAASIRGFAQLSFHADSGR